MSRDEWTEAEAFRAAKATNGLVRMNYPRTRRTFYARRKVKGRGEIRKAFADAKHGGPRGAYKAATEWLAELERKYGPARRGNGAGYCVGNRWVRLPRAYVRVIVKWEPSRCGRYLYERRNVVAFCSFMGKLRRTSFSIDKYGRARARRLALEAAARLEALALHETRSARARPAHIRAAAA